MSERLYYNDSYLLEFEGRITRVEEQEGRFCTRLDRSAFYPTSGGQMHDTGTLGEIAVVDVIELEDGSVGHITVKPVGNIGDEIRGFVDGKRRAAQRRQHSAQHILSRSFGNLFEAKTMSVHLGEEYASVEFDTDSLTPEQLAEGEAVANQIIHESLPIEIMFVDQTEAAKLPLRKIPDREGKIRIIKMGEFEWSACGGTHCRMTSEIGLIKIIGTERIRGRLSVRFLCGDLAIEDYQTRFNVTDSLSRSLTCHVEDLPEKFRKMQNESKQLRKEVTALSKQLLPIQAKELADQADNIGANRVLAMKLDSSQAANASVLATIVAGIINGPVMFAVENRLILGTAEPGKLTAGQIARQLCEKFGLRGGGGKTTAQIGSVDVDSFDLYKAFLCEIIANE